MSANQEEAPFGEETARKPIYDGLDLLSREKAEAEANPNAGIENEEQAEAWSKRFTEDAQDTAVLESGLQVQNLGEAVHNSEPERELSNSPEKSKPDDEQETRTEDEKPIAHDPTLDTSPVAAQETTNPPQEGESGISPLEASPDISTEAHNSVREKQGETPARAALETGENGVARAVSNLKASPENIKGTVLSGDSNVIAEFYQTLRQRGKLVEREGEKIVYMSETKQAELLKEIADSHGFKMQQIATLSMPKKDNLYSRIFKRDSLRLIVVGDDSTIKKKQEEVSTLFRNLEKRGIIEKAPVSSKPAEDKTITDSTRETTIEVKQTAKDALQSDKGSKVEPTIKINAKGSLAQVSVVARETHVADNSTTAKDDYQNRRNTGKESNDKTDKLSNYEKELPKILQMLTSSKEGLMLRSNDQKLEGMYSLGRADDKPGNNQFAALRTMKNVAGALKDSELSKMDVPTRQEFLSRLVALSVLAAENPFQSEQNNNRGAKDAEALRPRLDEILSKERSDDPKFVEKSSEHVRQMTSSGVLTEAQSERVTALLDGRTLEVNKNTLKASQTQTEKDKESHAERTDPMGRREPYIGENLAAQKEPATNTSQASDWEPAKTNEPSPHLAEKSSQITESPPTKPTENLSAEDRLKQAVAAGVSGKELDPFIAAVAAEAKAQVTKQGDASTKTEQEPPPTNQSSTEQKPQTKGQEQTPTPPVASNFAPIVGSSLEAAQPTAKEDKTSALHADFHKNEATRESVNYLLSTTKDRAPHAFITKGKEWNLNTIEKYAKTLTGLDITRVEQTVSPDERAKLVTHAGLIVDAASNGKIPGFTKEQIAVARKKLIEMADNLPKSALTKETMDVATRITSNMLSVMAERQAEASLARFSTPAPIDAKGLTASVIVRDLDALDRGSLKSGQDMATGLARSVYGNKSLSRKEVTGALRMGAGRISSQALRGLSLGARARAVTAISTLVSKTLQGDFGKVDNNLRDQANALQGVANEVMREMQQDPRGQQALNDAQKDLGRGTRSATNKALDTSQDKGVDRPQAAQNNPRTLESSVERNMER